MPIYNSIYTSTITSGGGTINLDVDIPSITRYIFSGTATLSSSWTIQPTGTPFAGMEFDIRWQAAITLNTHSVTIFGTALTEEQARTDLQISCYYNGSSWDVDIISDGLLVGEVTNTNMANMPPLTFKGNEDLALSLPPQDLTIGDAWVMLGGRLWRKGIGTEAVFQQNLTAGNPNAQGPFSLSLGTLTETGVNGTNAFSGGSSSQANDLNSFAFGASVISNKKGTFSTGASTLGDRIYQVSHSGGKAAIGYSQKTELHPFVVTPNATPVQLRLDGAGGTELITIPIGSVMLFEGKLLAVQRSGSAGTPGDNASWIFNGTISNIGGTTALVDSVLYQDGTGAYGSVAQRSQVTGSATWTIVVTADDTNDALAITVTGEANKSIGWYCVLNTVEIKYV